MRDQAQLKQQATRDQVERKQQAEKTRREREREEAAARKARREAQQPFWDALWAAETERRYQAMSARERRLFDIRWGRRYRHGKKTR